MKKGTQSFFEKPINVFLFLFIPTLLLYAKTFGYKFTPLDERWLIIDNVEYLKSWKSLFDAFTSSLYRLYYRPLLAASIFFDYKISGLSPVAYHVTNFIWHFISVLCLFKLLTLFDVQRKTCAWLCLIFSLHPILVHAVAWVPGRNDLMLGAFTLGSLIYLKIYLNDAKIKFLALSIFFFICTLFTKENAVSLPAIFIIISYGKIPNRKLISLTVLWVITAALWLLLRNMFVPHIKDSTFTLQTRVLNFFSGLLTYIGKSVVPLNQSIYPTLNQVSNLIGVLSVIVIVALFFKPGVHDRRTAFTGLAFFFILLILPVWFSSGKPFADYYEHRSYTSTFGLILFISQLRFNWDAMVMKIVAPVLTIAFFAKSNFQMKYYKDEDVFLEQAVIEQPDYFLFQAQFANRLLNRGDYANAIKYYNSVIAKRPDKAEFFNDRGRAYFALGDYLNAAKDISSAIEITGFNADYYLNRCMAYNAADASENAMKDLYVLMKCCRETVPEDLKNQVGSKWRALFKMLNDQLATEPENAKLLFRRSKMYFDTGQKEKGFADLKQAMVLEPQNEEYKKLFVENQK